MISETVIVVADLSSMPYPIKVGDPIYDKWVKDHWRQIGTITNIMAPDKIQIELFQKDKSDNA